MAKTAVLLVCCAAWGAQARFLAPPTANATASNTSTSDDDEIAALSAQIADTEGQVETFKKTSNITEDEDPLKVEFHHHCKPEDKAKLDKAKPEDEVFPRKKEDTTATDGVLGVFAESMKATERKSLIENEEFLLGLLMMHHTRADWTREQELDAICSMANESPLAEKLYKNHTSKQPLAMQFAMLMDAERKTMKPTSAPPLSLDGGVNSLGMKEGGGGGGAMGIIAKLMASVGGGKKQKTKKTA